LDLARHGETLLFLIPLLMLAVVVAGVLRRETEKQSLLAILSIVAATVSGYLMNKQRVRVHDEGALISAQLTGWFWLGFMSTLAVAAPAVGMLITRKREP
jgi:uncharacterized membrane protein